MKSGITKFDVIMLIFRLIFGLFLALFHGLPKLVSMADRASEFIDPIGIGSGASMFLAMLSELFCSILVIAGALTRIAVIPVLIIMLIAIFIVHSGESWGIREPATLFGVGFTVIGLFGAGKLSFDYLFFKRY